MDVIIVGAGPAGLTLGGTLAHRGHRVLAIDSDPGPAADGSWRRRGVMQFDHAHGFRSQVPDLLKQEWPEAWTTWRGLGAEPIEVATPDGATATIGVRSRRITYERALRRAAREVDGLTVATGRVERLVERNGRAIGAIVDGREVPADLVVDASGRLSRLAAPALVGADVGMAYVGRTFRRLPGAPPGPMTRPVAWSAMLRGYDTYVFPHEHGHVSAVVIRPTADAGLGVLHDVDAFEAACRAIPGLSDWTDPRHAVPTSGVLVGGNLTNAYRPQRGLPGLVAIGDAVATTAPTAGRGVAMASLQVGALLEELDADPDPTTLADRFDAWCNTRIRPWVEDHLAFDAETVRRWQGHDLDLSRPLTSQAIVAAAEVDPRIGQHVAGFMAMTALPETLAPAEPLARAVYESGWRPDVPPGPDRDELLALAHRAAGAQEKGDGARSSVAGRQPALTVRRQP